MKAFLLTVPGTGTRFTRSYIETLGYVFVSPQQFAYAGDNSCCFDHAMNPAFDYYYDLFRYGKAKVVSTLRDPYAAHLSGIERPMLKHGRNVMPKDMQAEKSIDKAVAQWDAMIAAHERLDADGVSIAYMDVEETSVPDRMDMLTAIADHLEVNISGEIISELAQTWAPVGKSGRHEKREEYRDHGTINGVVPTALDFAVTHVQGLR